jgi:uncharacterized protein (DUF302 family)
MLGHMSSFAHGGRLSKGSEGARGTKNSCHLERDGTVSKMKRAMLFEISSAKSLEQIDRALQEAAARHRFGIIATHNLKETMKNKGVEFDGECVIYEVCNPHQAKKVLEADGAISTALPCRISVYRAGGQYRLATLLPTALLRMFQKPELEPVAEEVEAVIKAMIEEAARAEGE